MLPCAPVVDALQHLDEVETCATAHLLAVAHEAHRSGLAHCLEPALAAHSLGLDHPEALPPSPPGSGKQVRDSFGVPESLESDNFVVRWGNYVEEDEAQAVLDVFEATWTALVVDDDYPGPWGTDSYKFNVYIGDSGGNTPSSLGYGGYYWVDGDGWPMVVMSRDALEDPEMLEVTGSHEFFHALQAGIDSYGYEGDGAWFWEATATWAAGHVYPDNTDYAVFLFGWAYQPHLSVDFFDYPDGGTFDLTEYHQYGAFIWPQYLVEHALGPELIRDAWLEGSAIDPLDPMHVLDELAAEGGVDLEEAFADFAVRNVTWDYAHGDAYAEWVDVYRFSFDSDRLVATHVGHSNGWAQPAASLQTRPWGVSYVAFTGLGSDVTVGFEADVSAQSAVTWWVNAVVVDDDGYTVTPIELEAGTGEQRVPAADGASKLWLVVAATAERGVPDTALSWRYRVDSEASSGGDGGGAGPGEEPGGCSCGTGAAGFWLFALAAAARRRSSTTASTSAPSRMPVDTRCR